MPPDAPANKVRHVYALLRDARVLDRTDKLSLFRWILHDPSVMSTNDLGESDLDVIINCLSYWQRNDELVDNTRNAVKEWNSGEAW